MSLGFALVVSAALTGALELSDRSELRLRSSGDAAGAVLDVETAPAATLWMRARRARFSLAYAPRFTLRQIDVAPAPEAFHHGTASLTVTGTRSELIAEGDLAYGRTTFTSLYTIQAIDPARLSVERIPAPSTIAYLSSRASLSMSYALSSRLTIRGQAEHLSSGGADANARAVIPSQAGPHGRAELHYALSRMDALSSTIDMARTLFSTDRDNVVSELREDWRHVFSRRTSMTLGAGASLVMSRASSEATWTSRPYATADAMLAHRAPSPRIEAALTLRFSPVVDRLTGLVDPRIQGAAALTWTFTPSVDLRTQFGAAQSVQWNEAGATRVVLGEAAIAIRATRTSRIELGTRVASQFMQGAGAAPAQWMMFTGATFALPRLRF
jgi:hypothetical protein